MFHQLPPVVTVAGDLGAGHAHLGIGDMFPDRLGSGADEAFGVDTAHKDLMVKPGGEIGTVFHLFALNGGDFIKGFVVSAPDGIEISDGLVLFLHLRTEIFQTVF